MGGVLAIDVGTKRTGFAVADPQRIVTQALGVCPFGEDSRELLDHIAGLLEERDVGTLLVGLPLDMDGREGARAQATRRFVGRLAERFPGLDVVPYDERLTTKAAEELLREVGHSGRAGRKLRDSYSALVLLRDWVVSGEPG
ncbi:MAG: Holliday junction resolvase RuvX [Planctomycetota bacterium]|nr:Holliday junction resolvase RuvX [Planctomycetota bacterium]